MHHQNEDNVNEIEGKDKDNMSDEFLDKYPMLRRHFPILWYLLLLSREIDTRRGEGDQESDSPLAGP